MIASDYDPPSMLADEIDSFYGDKRDLKVLDAAARTGRVGKEVLEAPFLEIFIEVK